MSCQFCGVIDHVASTTMRRDGRHGFGHYAQDGDFLAECHDGEGVRKLIRDRSTPENRRFWDGVERAAAQGREVLEAVFGGGDRKTPAPSPSVPVIPPLPPLPPAGEPNPVVAWCGECGLGVRRVMHYVCHNARCPVFPKVSL